MQAIAEGIWHWTAENPDIGQEVSSYYLGAPAALLDPQLDDPDTLGDRPVEHVVLTNRLHGRDTADIVARHGARVHSPRAGLHHFEGRPYDVLPFEPGDRPVTTVTAHELAAIAPDDGVLHIEAGDGALHFADGLLVRDGDVALMPDELMDDPDQVRRLTRDRLRPLLELPFDALLFAHSDPIATGGRDRLAAWLSA